MLHWQHQRSGLQQPVPISGLSFPSQVTVFAFWPLMSPHSGYFGFPPSLLFHPIHTFWARRRKSLVLFQCVVSKPLPVSSM